MTRARGLALAALAGAAMAVLPAERAAARDPVYRTPGYKGTTKTPRTRPARPPNPIPLGTAGVHPDVAVDAAGTAHIVWDQDGTIGSTADVLRYCRLKRGATACDVSHSLIPPQPQAGFNQDTAGPKVVAVGDDVALLTFRYPVVINHPDGGTSDRTLYLYLSDDGGNTFSPPVIVSNAEPSGDAIAFGPPESPQIGLISDTRTGGTFFQGLPPGVYSRTQANLALPDANRAYSGSLGLLPDGRPIAAFSGLDGQASIRAWSGTGSVNNPATWSDGDRFPGTDTRIATGPAGSFVLAREGFIGPLNVRRLEGTSPGPPRRVSNTDDAGFGRLLQDPGGQLRAAWVAELGQSLVARRSFDGRAWGPTERLARSTEQGQAIGDPELAATDDGGGFAVFTRGTGVAAVPFGPRTATGRPGLGGLAGSGLPPDTVTSCQRISFGAIEILATEGCFLSAVSQPGVKVSQGTLLLNGMHVVPDPGVRITIDPRRRTLDSSGSVAVELRGVGRPVRLWKGPLHLDLSDASPGADIAEFDTGRFEVDVKGFKAVGKVDAEAARGDGVKIPLELEIFDELDGAITGSATLVADNAGGLHLESLKFGAELADAGPLQLASLEVEYEGGEDTWEGSVEVSPAGAKVGLSGSIKFRAGNFVEGKLSVPFDFPGLPVFKGVYLTEVSGGFGLRPAFIEAGTTLGVIPLAPGYGEDVYVLGIENQMRVQFSPLEFQLRGEGKLFNRFAVQEMLVRVSAEGFAQAAGGIDLDLGILALKGAVEATFDPPREQFGGQIDVRTCVPSDFCLIGYEAVVSSVGVGGCVGGDLLSVAQVIPRGFGYRWGDSIPGDVDIIYGDCDLGPYKVTLRPDGARSRAAQAGGAIRIARGTRLESVRVEGSGGAPSIVLTSPTGERITPTVDTGVPVQPGGTAALRVAGAAVTYLALSRPAAGEWRVEAAPGSAPIASIAQASALPAPKLSARVRGRGRKRELRWSLGRQAGLTVAFSERGPAGARRIGRVRGGSGTISFSPADGLGRRRTLEAVIERDGLPVTTRRLGSFTAPRASRPVRVRGLRLRRVGRGGAAVASWRRARGASRYLVQTVLSSGRRELRYVRRPRHRIGAERDDRVRLTVRAVDAKGRTGRPARASLNAAHGRRR